MPSHTQQLEKDAVERDTRRLGAYDDNSWRNGARGWFAMGQQPVERPMNTPDTPQETQGTLQGIDLDELEHEARYLVGLLENRQLGLLLWNEMVKQRLETIHHMAHRVWQESPKK